MDSSHKHHPPVVLTLRAETAADLMTANPLSIRHDATIGDAGAFLVKHEISAAPVVDDAGRAVGVISHTDLVRHDSEMVLKDPQDAEYYRALDRRCPPAMQDMVYGKKSGTVLVREVMTPVVIQVSTQDAAVAVVAKLLALKIHRLFVVDQSETLAGVISTLDVLNRLHSVVDNSSAP